VKRRAVCVFFVLGVGLCCWACSGAAVEYDYSKEPDPRRSEYVIGASDRLSIRVWRNPDLSTDAVVRPDGTITMPLIGDILADGKTPSELKQDITKQLAAYVRDEGAVVTIAVTGINSYAVTVSGNVEHPGVFTSSRYLTVLEAMQLAGGPNRYASPRQLKIYRHDRKGNVRIVPIDYDLLVDGKTPQANLALIAGDQLYMP